MKFELDSVLIEKDCAASPLASRVLAAVPPQVHVEYVADGRTYARRAPSTADSFAAGKRQMIIMRRRTPFLMACPAGSAKFACCGYLVLTLASNCPMDCAYCFLQEYLADNPGFQMYANYGDSFDELERLSKSAPERHFRVGTGELADSLAFDRMTGVSLDLVDFFARTPNLLLELKTKTDEIDNLLKIDPRGNTLVSWTMSPQKLWRSSEHRTAAPSARMAAARRVSDAGYKLAFHFDPIVAYEGAERDYVRLLEEVFDSIAPDRLSFVSMGGLRMTPALKTIARRRFPDDPMLAGEEVLAPDGRFRTFTPLRLKLYGLMKKRLGDLGVTVPVYLCMEPTSIHRRVFGDSPAKPAALGERLACG